ncbi:hypothetical protein H0H92_011135 [Tricholoma furcatifolium]|nr:hypothetical protein H0H92_011135 [Tricholoma furcatifolium]
MSDDDYSDLTELSEDDDYGSSKSKTKKRASSPGGGYRIRKALKVPRATTYTAQALYGEPFEQHPVQATNSSWPKEQMHNDDIKLDPEYQRDVVWPDSKMVGLIDSIFRNFYVPPVIFSVVSYDDGSEKRICIDGKQRLTSIQRFMDGLIPHKDAITNDKLWYTDTGSSKTKRKLLPAKYRKLFANKQIVCVEYSDVGDSDEREIFQRVQLGMALTPAEKLQVVNTPRSSFVRELLSHFLASSPSDSSDGAGTLSHFDWERARGADYRCIAQIVYCLFTFPAFPPPGSTKPIDLSKTNPLKGLGSITHIEKFLDGQEGFTPHFEEKVRATLRVVGAMATDKGVFGNGKDKVEVRNVFRVPTKMSPVETVTVGLFVGVHMASVGCSGGLGGKKETKLEREEREAKEAQGRKILASGIRKMRADVRVEHLDIRMNARVSKTLIDFVRSWTPASTNASAVSATTTTTTTPATGKRKRKGKASLEDGEASEDPSADDGEVDVPLPLKFTKTASASREPPHSQIPAQSQSQSPALPPPHSLSTVTPTIPLVPSSSTSGTLEPDRMAVLRAAKMQAFEGHVQHSMPPPLGWPGQAR